jgi:hypothetical protein
LPAAPALEYIGAARAHAGGVTALSWAVVPAGAAAALGRGSSAGGGGGSGSRPVFFLPRRCEEGDILVLATGVKLVHTDFVIAGC